MLRKATIGLAGIALAMGLTTGCDWFWQPNSGLVLDTWHEPMWMSTTCSGNPMICTPVVWPEAWHLRLQQDTGKKSGHKGWRDVDERQYNNCWTGDHYPDCTRRPRPVGEPDS